MRRAVGFVVLLAGCAGGTPTQPEVIVEARSGEATPLPPPINGGVPVRGGAGEAPPEPPPKPLAPGTMSLPDGGGVWPWKLAPAPVPPPAKAVSFDVANGTVSGLAVARAARKAVVTVVDEFSGKSPTTRVILCDLAAGRKATEWEVPNAFEVIDLSPDGTKMLLLRTGGDQPPRDVLHVWTVAADLDLSRRSWQPHDSTRGEVYGELGVASTNKYDKDTQDRQVAWAAFVGADRIVTAASGGQLRVWGAAKLDRLGTIDATPGRPAVSPDGTRVAFLAPGGVALLDPAAAQVVGTRAFGVPAETRTLAFSPSGAMLACAGSERVAYLNLATGENWDAVGQKLGKAQPWPKTFGWVGESHVLAEHHLFDTESPMALWRYDGWEKIAFRSHEAWVATSSYGRTATVVGYTLPQPGLVPALAAKLKTPGLFVLRAGDAVRVDVSGLPADKQAASQAALERRLEQVGYRPSPTAAAVLFASEDKTGKPRSAPYLSGYTMRYQSRDVRLKLTSGGQTLWEYAAHVGAPYSVAIGSGPGSYRSMADAAAGFGVGRPDYTLFEWARIPAVFAGPKFPHFGFGTTHLEPTKMAGDLLPRN